MSTRSFQMHTFKPAFGLLTGLALALTAQDSAAQSACPQTSPTEAFGATAMSTNCTAGTTQCSTRSGTTWDNSSGSLKLPGSAGNFQAPPGASVPVNVYYAAVADFDKDGWEDFVAADDNDTLFLMRNQTITCGKTSCSNPPTVQNIPSTDAWWATMSNVRLARFATKTTSGAAYTPIKAGVSPAVTQRQTPMAAADFNGDGWPDFIAISATHADNTTQYASMGDWPTAARLYLNTRNNGTGLPLAETAMSCSAWPATGIPTCATANFATFGTPTDVRTGLTAATTTVTTATAVTQKPGDFGPIKHPASNMVAIDVDGDHDVDFLYGHGSGTCPSGLCTSAGQVFTAGIDIWLNQCNPTAAPSNWDGVSPWPCPTGITPTFVKKPQALIPDSTLTHTTTNLGSLNFDEPRSDPPAFAFADIDNDGDYDLALGSPGCCKNAGNQDKKLRVFLGTTGNKNSQKLDTMSPVVLSSSTAGFRGSLTGVFVYDFSGDGKPDIITGGDAYGLATAVNGGETLYWKNSATSPAFTMAPTKQVSIHGGSVSLTASPPTFPDFDVGLMLDYDHDPYKTKDIIFTDGNTNNSFYIFPNRASPTTFAPCGEIASGTLPVSPTAELIITGARLTVSATVPAGTSIKYQMSNEEPPVWIDANLCTTAPLTDWCVTFNVVTGRAVRWRAIMDSNTSDGPGVCTSSGTQTPEIRSVNAAYVYTPSGQHYRAGVVVNDGVTYAGSFTQPGDRGHLYAINAGLNQTYWDAATKIDAQASRNVYTSNSTGLSPVRRDFTLANASTLQTVVGASTLAQAQNVITWVLSKRFGVNSVGSTLSKLGSVVSSTPAVLSVPFRPNWYSYASLSDRTLYDQFASTNSSRIPLVLFGSKDGMIHAQYSISRNISDPRNGTEAWAFIPPIVAASMTTDYTNSATTLNITAYPDGSPTLLDYKKSGGQIATAAIVNTGQGGMSITALDVTKTVTATSSTTSSVQGPTPMWSTQPGVSLSGKAMSKVGVARTKIGSTETYVLVAGTGPSGSCTAASPVGGTTIAACPGRVVSGYNLESGNLLWSFEMRCPLTSDITIFETDDAGEPGSPTLDGFADRAVFADECGYVYKVNPGQTAVTAGNPSGWIGNAGYGSIAIPNSPTSNNVARYAVFSTISSSGSLGGSRPITGTLGARVDSTTDVVLYFGTGGLETYDVSKVNHFYAVYARNGAIRSKLVGTCVTSGSTKCEKFYGGVVLTPDEVITQRTMDPAVGGTCDFGKTVVAGYSLNSGSSFTSTFTVDNNGTLAAVSGPLYGDAGALYFATLSGEIARIGTPRVADAGGDSSTGYTGGMATIGTETASATKPFALMGWRVVL